MCLLLHLSKHVNSNSKEDENYIGKCITSLCFSCISICLSVYLSFYLSVCLSVFLIICMSVFLSVCLYISLSIVLPICLYINLHVYLSVCLSIIYSIYLVERRKQSCWASGSLNLSIASCLKVPVIPDIQYIIKPINHVAYETYL